MTTTNNQFRQWLGQVRDPLGRAAALDPGGLALAEAASGLRWSWSELDSIATQAAVGMLMAGLSPGDRVAAVGLPDREVTALLHGCLRAATCLMPLSGRAPRPDLQRHLEVARPTLIVGPDHREALAGAASTPARVVTFAELLELGAEVEEWAPSPVRLRSELGLLFTSGTTGEPKPVSLTFGNQLASARGSRTSLGSVAGERWLLCLSPHHVGGFSMLMRSAVCRQPVVTVDRFGEQAVMAALAQWRPRLISLVPTMLTRLVEAGAVEHLRQARAILLGGAPARQEDVIAWARMGIPVCPSYGLTESNSQLATVPPGRAIELIGTVGFPHPFVGVALAREDGDRLVAVSAGQLGLIAITGPVVSPTLPRVPIEGAPRAARGRADWAVTRDLGMIDPRTGALVVHGRADDAILTGGETVHPEEVERILMSHSLVRDAAVRGVADPRWGQRLEALVVVVSEVSVGELDGFLRARLDAAKVPRAIHLVASLPRSEGGKLLRGRLGALTPSSPAGRQPLT
jgi:O-succinylbenzoic acid--CoA ligase